MQPTWPSHRYLNHHRVLALVILTLCLILLAWAVLYLLAPYMSVSTNPAYPATPVYP